MSQKYQLKELLRAVHLSGDQIGGIREIPSGALITVLGDAMVPGLTEVEYQGEHYALFHEDLVCRAMKVWAASGGR